MRKKAKGKPISILGDFALLRENSPSDPSTFAALRKDFPAVDLFSFSVEMGILAHRLAPR
jgi:hypothetical protein